MRAEEILALFSDTSADASSLGSMLERARDGTGAVLSPLAAQSLAEASMLERAPVIRCVHGLAQYRSVRFSKDVERLRRAARELSWAEGTFAIFILRAYYRFGVQWPLRGFAEVALQLHRAGFKAGRSYPTYAPKTDRFVDWMHIHALPVSGPDLAHLFRIGQHKTLLKTADRLVTDALVVLGDWCERWNAQASRAAG